MEQRKRNPAKSESHLTAATHELLNRCFVVEYLERSYKEGVHEKKIMCGSICSPGETQRKNVETKRPRKSPMP